MHAMLLPTGNRRYLPDSVEIASHALDVVLSNHVIWLFFVLSRQNITGAAQSNIRVLKRLERALAFDPEVESLSHFPSTYTARLAKRKMTATNNNDISRHVVLDNRASSKLADLSNVFSLENKLQDLEDRELPTPPDDVQYLLSSTDVTTVDPLADSIRELVKSKRTLKMNQKSSKHKRGSSRLSLRLFRCRGC